MPTLSTGLVIAGAYADKARRTLFAQLSDKIRTKEISSTNVAKAIADLNKYLYEVIVDKLKLEKGDVVRIRIDYEMENGEIKWDFTTLKIEAFKRIKDEEIEGIMKSLGPAQDIIQATPEYQIKKIHSSLLGDVYEIEFRNSIVGYGIATKVDDTVVFKAAVIQPTPKKIEGVKLSADYDTELKQKITEILSKGKDIEQSEAEKMIEEIRKFVS